MMITSNKFIRTLLLVTFTLSDSTEAQCTVTGAADLTNNWPIPAAGEDTKTIAAADYADFSAALPDCAYAYAFAAAPASAALTIDAASGEVKFVNSASAELTLSFDVVVTGTDALGVPTPSTVGPFQIEANCGADSTAITFGAVAEQSQAPNKTPPLSIAGQATLSNPTCAIESIVVDSADYTVVDNGAGSFTVAMTDAANGAEADYPYTVTASAKGGATASLSSSMSIAKVCVSEAVGSFAGSYESEIPEDGTVEAIFPAASTDYATGPPVVAGYTCSQAFSYVMADGSVNPAALTLDAATGIFTLQNDNRK